eukprot:g6269.t1
MMDGGMSPLADEAHEYTSLVGSASADGLRYESLVADEENVDVEAAAFEAAGEIRIIEPRKYRFTPTARVPTCPLRLMPLDGSSVQGTVERSCVVTAVAQKDTWLRVRVGGGKEGWMQSRFPDGTVTLTEVSSYRRHEEWGGLNHFFLGGKVMVGSDVRWFLSSNITLTVPTMFFVWEMFRGFPVRGGGVLGTVGLSLWALAMSNLWLTALSDPGIIPRNPSNERAPPPVGEAIGLHGFKYCETCNIFRPPRSKHCQSCNNCVDRFDHHCPWVGSCVAVRNYRYFFAFVGATVVLIFYMMAAILARVVLRLVVEGDGSVEKGLEIVASGPLDLLLTAMALLVGVPLLRLWWYHVQTILCKGQTTNEDMRGVYNNHHNTYHKGCVQNSVSLLCAPAPRSRLPDLSERVYVNEPLSSRGTSSRARFRFGLGGGGGGGNRGSRTFSWISPAGGFRFLGDSDGDCSDQQQQQEHQQQQLARRQHPLSASGSRHTSSLGSFASARSFATSSMEERLSEMSGAAGLEAGLLSGGDGSGDGDGEASGMEQTPAQAEAVVAAVAAALQEKPDDIDDDDDDAGGNDDRDASAKAFSLDAGAAVAAEEGRGDGKTPTPLAEVSDRLVSAGFAAGGSERRRDEGERWKEQGESALLGAVEEPPPPPPPPPVTVSPIQQQLADCKSGNGSPVVTLHATGSSTDSSWHGQGGKGSSPLVGLLYANSPRSAMSLSDGGGSTRGGAGGGAVDSSHSSGELSYSPTPPLAAARAAAAVATASPVTADEPVDEDEESMGAAPAPADRGRGSGQRSDLN